MADGEVKFTIRLHPEDAQALETERHRLNADNKSDAMRLLIRGLRTEIHPLGTLTADLRLPSFLVEWTSIAEDHMAGCKQGAPDCSLCATWIPLKARYNLTFRRRGSRHKQ
jgi:hypothetical protein